MLVQHAGTEGRDLSVPARHHETLRKHSKAAGVDAILAGSMSWPRPAPVSGQQPRPHPCRDGVGLTCLTDLESLSQLSQWLGQVRSEPPNAGPRRPDRPDNDSTPKQVTA